MLFFKLITLKQDYYTILWYVNQVLFLLYFLLKEKLGGHRVSLLYPMVLDYPVQER